MTEAPFKKMAVTKGPARKYQGKNSERNHRMAKAKQGNTVKVHYKGTLDDGTVFDSSEVCDPRIRRRPDGHPLRVTITRITESTVTLDANHPMAGKDLTFEIQLLEIAQRVK